MTRLRYAFDEARVQRFLTEGRGQGTGERYRPWLEIQDISSKGRSHRPYGIKSRRVHHLLSDGEWKCFLKLEAAEDVEDIQEQFPMDRMQTYAMAKRLRVQHPKTLDGTPYVMTLDFLVRKRSAGGVRLIPFTFKYDPETLTPREHELMDITRAFWREHGEELQLIDERFFDEPFNINYDSVRAYHDISVLSFYSETDVSGVAAALVDEVRSGSGETLLRTCRGFAGIFATTPQVVFQVAMHLVSRGVLRVDLSSPIGLQLLPMCAYTAAPIPEECVA
jgi:TnsA endonuclease N terminal